MPQTVEIPEKGIVEFPDGMSPEEIKGVVHEKFFSHVPPPQSQTEASKGSLRETIGKVLGKAQDIGKEAFSEFLPPEIMQTIFGGTTSSLRESEKSPPLISPEHAKEFVGELPTLLGGETELGKGIASGTSEALSEVSKPGTLAQLPAFAVPGVAETYAANVLADVPKQVRTVGETIQQHGIFSEETGKALAEAGIQDITGLLAGKTGKAAKGGLHETITSLFEPKRPVTEPIKPEEVKPSGKETQRQDEAQRQGKKGDGLLAETAPGVQPAPAPGTRIAGPALVDAEGNIVEQGKLGETHADLLDRALGGPNEEKAMAAMLEDKQHAFVDENGNVIKPQGEEPGYREAAARVGVASKQLPEGTKRVQSEMLQAPPSPQETQPVQFDLRTEAMRQAALHEPAGAPSQKLGITAPGSQFVKEDVARVVSGALKGTIKGFKQIQNILTPAAAGPEAKVTANIIRENAAELARKHEIATTELKTASKAFKKTDNQFNLDVIDKIETGTKQATPELDIFSKEIRRQLDARVAQVRNINPDAMPHLIEDYFGHIWTPESVAKLQADPNPVTRNVWSEAFGHRPLEGQKSFLKQRAIPTTMEGVALGLEPVSWNPVELQLLKLHEMDRYVMGQTILSEMKDQGLAKFVPAGEAPEPGHVQINDKIARVLAPRDWKIVDAEGQQMPGQKLLGHFYAPEDAARVINNYLSPGLRGNVAYDAFRWLGNIQNQVQLGISVYHATFTSLDAATSAFSLGLEQLARSKGSPREIATASLNIAKGIAEAATGVGGMLENLWRGNKFLREYSRPGTTNADLAHIVDTAVAGGARIRMDTFYKSGAVKSFFDAIKAGNYTGAILRAPFMAIEALSKPLMEMGVPRMKAGVISQMLEYELSKLPKDATQNDIRTIAGRVVDSVDNRMGQMIYDNLFWNRILKDGLMASVRSVGWNVGDIREIGGGLLDAVTAPARAYRELKGKTAISDNPVVTHRMAYVVGLPLIVGALGSMYQYLMTGEGPQDVQDAFMPKTGRKKADGTDERVMLPTYMKDIAPLALAGKRGFIPLVSRGVEMALNKLHPTLTMLSQMLHNQDYYGNQIRNVDDPLVKTALKEALFLIKQWKPFSIQGVIQREGGLKEKVQAVAGIMPAPGELTRTPAMQLIHEINLGKRPAGGYTEQQAQRREDRHAASEGQDLRLTLFKRLSQEERDRVMDVATPEEQEIFGRVKPVKHRRAFTIVK
jgi:hypothetical protein